VKNSCSKQTYQALRLYYAELNKLCVKYQKKQDAENTRKSVKLKYLTERELMDAYGYGYITRQAYEAALGKLCGREEAKTVAGELLRMIRFDMKSIKTEIAEIESQKSI
jgi:hypothetical protein